MLHSTLPPLIYFHVGKSSSKAAASLKTSQFAKLMRVEGKVYIGATVEPNGRVSEAKALSGNPLLAPAAEDAVRRWTCEPGPAKSNVTVSVNFQMYR